MTAEELKALAHREKNHRLKIRYLSIYHFLNGSNRTQIAKYLGVSRGSVNRWVTSYLNNGLDGLIESPRSGRPVLLSERQQKELTLFVKRNAVKSEGGRLIADDIKDFIFREFNIEYKQRNIYRLLKSLGFSWVTCRSKHPKQSKELQEAFKKPSDWKRSVTPHSIED